MKSKTLLSIFAVIAGAYGIIAVAVPGFLSPLLWPGQIAPNGYLLLQGWGACLFGLAVVAWGVRASADNAARTAAALGIGLYALVSAVCWFKDAQSRGWAPLGVASFALLCVFAIAFGTVVFGKADTV
jgi:hypothetical protein